MGFRRLDELLNKIGTSFLVVFGVIIVIGISFSFFKAPPAFDPSESSTLSEEVELLDNNKVSRDDGDDNTKGERRKPSSLRKAKNKVKDYTNSRRVRINTNIVLEN